MLNSSLTIWASQKEHKPVETEDPRERLQVCETKKADHIYYPNLIKKKGQSFVYFCLSPIVNEKNIYKLHISLSPIDYELVLYKSDLSRLLQEELSLASLIYIKYVDPIELKKISETVKLAHHYLLKFYPCIAKYNSFNSNQSVEKERYYKWLKTSHDWFTKSWGNAFTPLNVLLESTPEQLQIYKKEGFAIWKEVTDTNVRLEQEVQYTLYLPLNVSTEALVRLINKTTEYLTKIGVGSVPCPESDLPLTPFVSFRQDKFDANGDYIFAGTPDSLKLKEVAKNADLYKQLVQILAVSSKPDVKLEIDEFRALHL